MNVFPMVLALVGAALPLLAPRSNRRLGRRIFWSATVIAVTSAFFIAYPPDWKSGFALSLLFGGVMVFRAYTSTPYIKIRGRIYAYSALDRQADPPSSGHRSGK